MVKKLKHIIKNTGKKTAIGRFNMAIVLMILSVALVASLAAPASASCSGTCVGSVAVGAQSGSLTSGIGGSVTYPITVIRGTGTGSFSASLSITTSLPTGTSYSFSPSSLSFNSSDSTKTSTLTITTTGATPAGSTSFTAKAYRSSSDYKTGTGTLTVRAVTKSDQTITFGTLSSKIYGDADFPVSATASSTLAVSFAASGTCTVTGNSVHITGAGSCTITANQSGNASYNAAPDVSQSFTINQASSSVTVTCPVSETYTGSAIETCTASYSGLGGLSGSLTPTYTNNVVVGTATASATYVGDVNHAGSTNSATFGITPASSTTTVTCPVSAIYTGSAITPCSVTVTGAGGLSLTPVPVYLNNVDAGAASASYTYIGDTNHAGSSDSKTFTIDPASSTTTVTCPASETYTGSAIEPCTASYSGAGGLTGTLNPTYTNNVNVGTATADASYAGDANHAGSSGSDTFEIVSVHTYSVSGYVSDNLGAALSGVFVQNNSNSDTTIASGYYSISGLVNGTYSFSYSKAGFNTGYLEVTVSGANIETANKTILDTTAPETIIDSSPSVSSGSSSASFTFHSTETGSTFQCQLDSGSFSACSSPETYSGLADGSHTFNVAATDAMGNADATPASFTWTIDTIAPSAITNLAAGSPTTNSITLTWTAPGDNGITGTASQYDIRYSLSIIDNSNWDSATQVTGEPSPKAYGLPETFIVSGLSPSKLYHFAIKTGDEVPNWSGISNGAGATTTALPSVRYINGTVTSSSILHETLAGVTVTTGSLTTTTGPDGKYSFAVVSGTYDLTFNKNDIRYYTGSLTAVSTVSGDANGDLELQLKPVGTISGTVTVV